MKLARSEDAIMDVIDACMEQMNAGGSSVPGMTYEEGVEAALRWAIGESADSPLDLE